MCVFAADLVCCFSVLLFFDGRESTLISIVVAAGGGDRQQQSPEGAPNNPLLGQLINELNGIGGLIILLGFFSSGRLLLFTIRSHGGRR